MGTAEIDVNGHADRSACIATYSIVSPDDSALRPFGPQPAQIVGSAGGMRFSTCLTTCPASSGATAATNVASEARVDRG